MSGCSSPPLEMAESDKVRMAESDRASRKFEHLRISSDTSSQNLSQYITVNSGPSSSNNSESKNELLSTFECPICMDYMLPPYLQCPSGHLICGTCRPRVTCCPTCRGPIPSIRNLAMERISQNLTFPCKYNTSGCKNTFGAQEKLEHEEHCEHRPYTCPCPGAACKWSGLLHQVMTHLLRQHKSITTLQGEDIVFLATDINLPGAVDWVMMQNCFGYHFMLVLEKQDKAEHNNGNQQMFYAVVQLIGTKQNAQNFIYRLELSSKRRRLSFEGQPRSIHEGVAAAIAQSDCLSFDTNQAQLFSENGNLGINVTIQQLPPESSP